MISSFFEKTNPINFIAVFLLFSIHYWVFMFLGDQIDLSMSQLMWFFVKLLLVIFNVFLVEFMVKKNQISSKNTYAVLLFVLLLGMFIPQEYHTSSLLTLFFLLLALRRILSIRSLVSIKIKVFDASLWILAASYLNSYALYFFVVLALAIYFYQSNQLKNWLSMLPAVGAYLMLLYAYKGIDAANSFIVDHYHLNLSFQEVVFDYNTLKLIAFVIFGLLASIVTYKGLSRSLMGKLISVRLVFISFLIASLIALGTGTSTELVYVLFPAAVLFSNTLEYLKKTWIKEVILLVFISLPFVLLFL